MKASIGEILKNQFHIADTDNYDFKLVAGKEVSNKRVRGSLRSQLDKFLPANQSEINMEEIDKNKLL